MQFHSATQMTDLRQTLEYAKYMKSLGWKVEKLDGIYIYLKKIPLLGWYAKLQRPSGIINLDKVVNQLSLKYKITSLLFEPLTTNPPKGHARPATFQQSNSISLPSKTIQLDLSKAEQILLSEMKQKTRYNVRLTQKEKSIVIKRSTDISTFLRLWKSTALTRGTWLPQQKEIRTIFESFGKKAHLYMAFSNSKSVQYVNTLYKQPVAGLIVIDSPDTAYYLYAASTYGGKKLFAPTLLSWEAIREAKKRKLKIFDFDGIYDERFPRQTKAWRGFTKFKEGFGGKVVEFPQPLVYRTNFLAKYIT